MRRFGFHPLTLLAVLLALVVFFKNAWVCEDAYINFRSIEQLFAGRGPIWNPHERVQVFTSPLWFALLAVARLFSSHAFLNAVGLGLALWLAGLAVIRRLAPSPGTFLLMVLALSVSNGFSDYTTSGLENALLYLLLAVFVFLFTRMNGNQAESGERDLSGLWLVSGLVLLTRIDQVFLIAPALLAVTWQRRGTLDGRAVACLLALGLGPLAAWTMFSVIYYGFPLPNTAYAKLSTGIERFVLFRQGLKYFLTSLGFDTVTLMIVGVLVWWGRRISSLRWFAAGAALQLVYVASVGGDFMQGRFLATTYLVAVLALGSGGVWRLTTRRSVWVGLVLYAVFYPHTPINIPARYPVPVPQHYLGVADERGIYNDAMSLWQYVRCQRQGRAFPDMELRVQGEAFAAAADSVIQAVNIGVFGYASGTEKIIIDHLALSDPLLARLPCQPDWRVGHYIRDIPAGYEASLRGDKKTGGLEDAHLQKRYDDLILMTRSPQLFSRERWQAILRQNF